MKFIDKYNKEHPERLIGDIKGIYCPSDFGYEPDRNCTCGPDDEACCRCWNREMPESEPKPANANLFPGFEINDIVMTRGGRLCIILPNERSKDDKSLCYLYNTEPDHGSGVSCLAYCCDYADNLYKNNNCLNDIVKLWRSTTEIALALMGYFFNKNTVPDFIKPIWVEPSKKKMTLKEIENELGYPVEIISEPGSEDENK